MKRPFRFTFVLPALLALWPVSGSVVAAQGETPVPVEIERELVETAPVVIDGETLFRVRGVSARPAAVRAEMIAGRIRELARDRSVGLDAVVEKEAAWGIDIAAGDRPLMTVTEADARLEGVDRAILAHAYAARIRQSVELFRRDREGRRLLWSGLYTLIATVLFLLGAWLLRAFFRRFHAHLDRHYHARIKSLKLGSFTVIHAEQGWVALRKSLLGLQLAILVVAAYIYLEYVFHLYPWTRPAARDLLSYVFEPVRSIAFALLAYLPKLAFLVILTILTRYLLKLTRLFFASIEAGTVALGSFDPDWATPTYKLVRMAVIAFALVVAYPYLPGSDSAAFKGISLFLGVMLSLGSSSAISNVVAGYSMTYRKAFKQGDRVKIGDQIGEVLETRLLVTRLRTPKNEEVIIPNSEILNQHVVNFSSLARTEGLILHTRVGIGYETPWRQVEAMLLAAAERTPGLKSEPPPFVLQRELGDFAVTYELNVYTDRPGAMLKTYTELHRNILDLFNEYGVQIMTPAYEGDPEQPKIVPKEQWHTAPAPPPPGSGSGSGPER